jgi:hypothetical protein
MVFFMTSGNFKQLVAGKMHAKGMARSLRVAIGKPSIASPAAARAPRWGHLKSGRGDGRPAAASSTAPAGAAAAATSSAAVAEANALRKGLLVALAALVVLYAVMGARLLLKGGGVGGGAPVSAPDWAAGRAGAGGVALGGMSTTEERQALQAAEAPRRRELTDDELREELDDI